MKIDLAELDKLEQYLSDRGILYERYDNDDMFDSDGLSKLNGIAKLNRHQIIVSGRGENHEWDAICQYGSYGYEEGLLEIYGRIVSENAGDSVEGWLTANDVIERIEKVYGENETD